MKRIGCIAIGVLLTSGCIHHRHHVSPFGLPPRQVKKVAHVHAHGCGHVFSGQGWVTVSPGKIKGPKQGKGKKH